MRKVNRTQKKQKLFEPQPSDKAFVYQQALELAWPVAVFMSCKKDTYSVIFVLDPLHERLEVSGEGKNFIEACLKAKRKAQKKVSLLPHYNYEEKEALVDMLKHNVLIH